MSATARPQFFRVIALALAAFTIIGFARTYYLRFLSDLPPLTTLVQLHGAVFTAWLALLVVQTRLVAAHRVDLHMRLGIAGVVLAILVVCVGFAAITGKSGAPFVHPSGLNAAQFSIIGLVSIGTFALFIALGVAFRRRPAMHKRFMLLATIAILMPPSSRILTLLGLRPYWSYLVPVLPTLFIVWCMAYDWRHHRRVHPVFAIGGAAIVASWPLRLIAGRSEWYQPVGEWIGRLGS